MSDADEEEVEAPEPPGLPAWVMTFADLMSLLMCFFVLLLSFSQMDLAKFKKVAGSMDKAFGVQREIVAYEIPKGTSIIAKEFSPGKPTPTALNEIRQKTVEEMKSTLEFDEIRTTGDVQSKNEFERAQKEKITGGDEAQMGDKSTETQTAEIAEELMNELMDGMIEVESFEQRIVIRILEQGSFKSGEDVIRPSFVPVINKIRKILEKLPGKIIVSGHTDDIPIYTSRFRSNWELSTARAVSVAHHLLDQGGLLKNRLVVSGFADTKPLFKNDTKAHRAHNRRVEIELIQNEQNESGQVNQELKKQNLKRDKETKKSKPESFKLESIQSTSGSSSVPQGKGLRYSTDNIFGSHFLKDVDSE